MQSIYLTVTYLVVFNLIVCVRLWQLVKQNKVLKNERDDLKRLSRPIVVRRESENNTIVDLIYNKNNNLSAKENEAAAATYFFKEIKKIGGLTNCEQTKRSIINVALRD